MMTEGKEASFEKLNIWKPEDIITEESVVKENIVPYGNSQDKLVPGLHYPLPSSGGVFMGNVTYTTTGVKTVTGVGFKPSHIKLSVVGGEGSSQGFHKLGVENSIYMNVHGGLVATGATGNTSYVEGAGGNPSSTSTITPTADGFTINVWTVSGGPLYIIYECYG